MRYVLIFLMPLRRWKRFFRRIKSPMTTRTPCDSLKAQLPIVRMTMESCHTRMQTVRGVLYEIYSVRLSDQVSSCRMPLVLDRLRELEEVDKCMDAKVGKSGHGAGQDAY
ncbi:hypothetical protein GDR29_15755 [Xanthomonas oryzae pv. oryzae]|nr:hypothetical protein GDR29_15755 [Xanthomonas oryzae pv. oryzae]